MSRTIWKFPLKVADKQVINMPVGAKILHVGLQKEIPAIWAEVNDDAEVESREICIFGTGHPMPLYCTMAYLGSFMMLGGDLVFHVYEST